MIHGNGRIDLVLVDFDDTLVDTGPRFQGARRSLLGLMEEAGFAADAAHDMLYNQVDPAMRAQYGLGPRRMEPAFVATYEALCAAAGRPVDPALRERCAELGRSCYGPPPAFDGALDALRRLSASHRTVIYTQSGDLEYQQDCIRGVGIVDIVSAAHVHVCSRKDVEMFRQTLQAFDVRDPAAAWMIGNSMRSDINPALEAGANAILVETHDPWEYDLVEPVSPRFHRVRSFTAAVELLVP
ncbi:MAG TPA: HAD family hydrolase [Longimicrobiales bacterium]|nr:HAD family hydrolase [Longimicrobiales bacterium]